MLGNFSFFLCFLLFISKLMFSKKSFGVLCWFVWFDSLHPSQQFFSYVGMGLPGLNQY